MSAKRLGDSRTTLSIALSCLFMPGVMVGVLVLNFAQHRGESRVVEALRFELRKHGAVKGYDDKDYEIVAANAEYSLVEKELAWAVVKAENARAVALGGVLTPISWEIKMRAAEREWPHYQLVKGIQHYQIAFIRRHPGWWADYCRRHKHWKTRLVWRRFFWDYRTKFVRELSNGWLAAHDDGDIWRRNVLAFWKQERKERR